MQEFTSAQARLSEPIQKMVLLKQQAEEDLAIWTPKFRIKIVF